jgi:hypothetical protein
MVKISNQEWCGDMGELGASCFNTLNDETRDIEKPEWDEERFGMLCAKPAVFADTKATILKLCKAYKKCVWDSSKNSVSFINKRRRKVITMTFFDKVEQFDIDVQELKEKNL